MKTIYSVCLLSFSVLFTSCKKQADNTSIKEAYNTGEITILVEESIAPIFNDLNAVFKSRYPNAILKPVIAQENQITNLLIKDSARLAFLPNKLDEKQQDYLKNRATAKQTPVAKDAILFLVNKSSTDTLVHPNEIIDLLKNPEKTTSRVFVFNNINSSLINYFKEQAKVTYPGKNLYFLNSTAKVLEHVSNNSNAIGVVGINWLLQPNKAIEVNKSKLKYAWVFNEKEDKYFQASQTTIADGTYPLSREIHLIDLQGKSGLGKGFSSFAASDIGQRVVLKSSLVPYKMPTREIHIKSEESEK